MTVWPNVLAMSICGRHVREDWALDTHASAS